MEALPLNVHCRGEGENAYVMIWMMGRCRDSSGYGGNDGSIALKRPLQNPIVNILALGNGQLFIRVRLWILS